MINVDMNSPIYTVEPLMSATFYFRESECSTTSICIDF